MRKFRLLIIFLLLSVYSFAADFNLKGIVSGVKKGDAFILVALDNRGKATFIDTIKVFEDNVVSFHKKIENDYQAQLIYCSHGNIVKENKKNGLRMV